jgi:hypothetical protein
MGFEIREAHSGASRRIAPGHDSGSIDFRISFGDLKVDSSDGSYFKSRGTCDAEATFTQLAQQYFLARK